MTEITQLLTTPAFWFSTILLAFLMSLFAAYAKDWLDHLLQRRTATQDAKASAKIQEFEERVRRLKTDATLLGLYQTNIIYQKLRQVLYFGAAYAALALSLFALVTGHAVGAVALFGFAVAVTSVCTWLVDPRLHMLRATVNAVQDDSELSFRG